VTGSEEPEDVLLDAAQLVVVDLHAGDAPGVGADLGLWLVGLPVEDP